MSEMPLESPVEDVAEQRADVYPGPVTARTGEAFEADPADARDQADEVPLDEDDYQ